MLQNLALRDRILSVPGCVGLYMCDEMSGTLARDLTRTNQGTYTGSPALGAPSVTPGDPIPSVKHDGSSTYVLVKSGLNLGTLANSSILAGIKTTNGRSGGAAGLAIYCERAAAGNDIWKLEMSNSANNQKTRLTHRNDAGTLTQVQASTAINDGKPHVVGISKAGTAVRYFLDGVLNGTATLNGNDTMTNTGVESRIASDIASTAATWADWIGFVALFNRTITDSEAGRVSVAALGL